MTNINKAQNMMNIARQIAEQLDKSETNSKTQGDGFIEASIWNKFIGQGQATEQQIGNGEKSYIRNRIRIQNAVNSILSYIKNKGIDAVQSALSRVGVSLPSETTGNEPDEADTNNTSVNGNFELIKTENDKPYYKDSGKLALMIDKYTKLITNVYRDGNSDKDATIQLEEIEEEIMTYTQPIREGSEVVYIESGDMIMQFGGKGAWFMETYRQKCCIYPKNTAYDETYRVHHNIKAKQIDPKSNGLSVKENENGEKYYKDNGKYRELREKFDKINKVWQEKSSRYACSPIRSLIPEFLEVIQAEEDLQYYENQIIGGGSDVPNDSVYIESGGVVYKFSSVEKGRASYDGHQYSWLGFGGIPVDEMA